MANAFSLFGTIGVNTKPLEDGLNKAETRLRDSQGRFVKAGEAAEKFGASTTTAGKSVGGFSQVINDNAGRLADLGGSLAAVGGALTAATTAIAGATMAMFALTKETAAYGSLISDLSDKTGLGAEALTALDYAAGLSGTSIEEVSSSVSKFNRLIGEAATGSDEAKEKLARLGITPEQGMNDLEGALTKVLAKIHSMPAGAAQTKLAMDAFGRSGANLLPMIKTMGGDFDALKKKAGELGLTFDSDVAQALDGFDDKLAQVDKQFAGIKRSISIAFLPIFQKMADSISNFIANNKDTLSAFASTIAAPFEWLAEAFSNLPSGVQTFIVALGGLLAIAGPVLVAVGGMLAGVTLLPGLWTAVTAGAGMAATSLASFAVAAAPVVATVAAIAAVAYLLYKAWDTNFLGIVDIVTSAWETVKSAFMTAIRFIDDVIAVGLAFILQLWEDHSGKIFSVIDNIKSTITNVFNKIKSVAVGIYGAIVQRLNDFWEKHGDFIMTQLNRVWTIVQTVFAQVQDYISTVFKVIGKLIQGDWAGAWEEAKGYLSRTWDRIKVILATALAYILDQITVFIPKMLGFLRDAATWIWDTFWKVLDKLPGLFNDALSKVGDVLKAGATFLWDSVKAIATGVLNILGQLTNKALEYGKAFINEFARGLSSSGNFGIAFATALGVTSAKVSNDISNSFNGVALPAVNAFNNAVKTSSTEAGFLEGIINSLSGSITGLFDSTNSLTDANKDNADSNKDNADALAGGGGKGGGKSVKQAANEAAQAIASTRMELLLYGKETRLAKFDTEAMAGAYSKWTDAQILFQRWQLFTLDLLDRTTKAIEAKKKAMDSLVESLKKAAEVDMGPIGDKIKGILPNVGPDGGPSIQDRRGPIDLGPMEPPPIAPWDTFFGKVREGMRKLKEELPSFKDQLANTVVGFVDMFGNAFANAVNQWDGTLKGFLNSLASTFRSFIKSVIAELMRLVAIRAATKIFEMMGIGLGGAKLPKGADPYFAGIGWQAKAAGGLITGPGSGTSDSIPTMLSNGEYVIPAASVRKFGVGFFEALRQGAMPFAMPTAGATAGSQSNQTMNNNFNINVSGGGDAQKTGAMVQREILTALQKTQRRNR